MADNSLDLENILPGDNTNANPLSLLTSSPPDDSLSNDNTGIDATTELSSADGGNRGKAQDSLKNVDSLRLASGTGNCKSDAGDTRPGRRRLRRARDSCAFDYGEFVPSLPKVSHDQRLQGGFGGHRREPFRKLSSANLFDLRGYVFVIEPTIKRGSKSMVSARTG